MDYKYSFTDDTTCKWPPGATVLYGIQECLTNSQKYFGTFQLFIHATKITNFWSQQHNLFLECMHARIWTAKSWIQFSANNVATTGQLLSQNGFRTNLRASNF